MLYYKEYKLSDEHDWVVFVHGAGGSSSIWFKQVREFKKHYNVLLVDLRGHGRSQGFIEKYYKSKYTFDEISKDVLDVLDDAKIEKAHFVGISLGSIIIRKIMEMAPHKVQTMILGGAVTRLNIRSRFLVTVGNLFKQLVPFMWLYRLFAFIIMPKKRHAESRMLFVRDAKQLCKKEFLRWYQLTAEINPLLRLFHEKVSQVPTLYLMGEEDYMFLPPVKKIVKQHKNAILKVLENCGHVCNVEQPELFNEVAISFINQHMRYGLNKG